MNPDGPKILVVDDSPSKLFVTMEHLTENGFSVSLADSGDAALAHLATAPADLILLDVLMPGIDGFETCRRLKADPATCDIPVIFMTALADSKYVVKGFAVGGADYVIKPIRIEEMLVRVNTHLGLRNTRQRLSE